jgi:alpha-tubulin suppressor-like RCC1 family protein
MRRLRSLCLIPLSAFAMFALEGCLTEAGLVTSQQDGSRGSVDSSATSTRDAGADPSIDASPSPPSSNDAKANDDSDASPSPPQDGGASNPPNPDVDANMTPPGIDAGSIDANTAHQDASTTPPQVDASTNACPASEHSCGAGCCPAVLQLAVGTYYACALTSAKTVECWGANSSGQLGDGTTVDRFTPVMVTGLSNVASIYAGWSSTCAVLASGEVMCWGYDSDANLGNEAATASPTPTPVVAKALTGLSVQQLALGSGTLCALSNGAVKCLGTNSYQGLGSGVLLSSTTLQSIPNLGSGVSMITAGSGNFCAELASGAHCWGLNNYGQLGNGSLTNSAIPVAATGPVQQFAAGNATVCGVASGGHIWCWGNGAQGQLGNGGTTSSETPVEVEGIATSMAQVAVGDSHACGRTQSGGVLCWGDNSLAQIGDGTLTTRLLPQVVPSLSSGVVDLHAGRFHTCALTSAGAVMCWGSNQYGQLGDGTNASSVPVQVEGI